MFFQEEDVISMHTVVCAAQGVLRDLAMRQGINVSIKDSPLVSGEAHREFLNSVNYLQNFFKHADKDPQSRASFRFKAAWLFILDSVVLFNALQQPLSHEMRVFLMWLQLTHPGLLCVERAEQHLLGIRATTQDPASFKALARVLLREGESGAT